MFKLIKFLKPFALSVFLIFALLFAQAQADLALPDYMSQIVNNGLQRGGIVNAIPVAIRATEWDRLLMLMNENDRAAVTNKFERIDKVGENTVVAKGSFAERYPILKTEAIVRPLSLSTDEQKQINSILTRAMTMYQGIKSGQGVTPGQLPAGSDPFAMLAGMPAAARQSILDKAGATLDTIPEAVQQQATATFLTAEYKAVGLDPGSIQTQYILNMGGMMLLIALLGAVCTVIVGYLAALVAAGMARNLRTQVFRKVESFSNTEFDTFSTASLITRSTNDIQQIQTTLVILLRILFYAPILAIGGILKVVQSDVSMTWIIAAAIAALMTMILILFIVAIPRFKTVQKLVDRLNLVTREILTGLPVIRAFNTESHQEAKFDQANKDLTKVNLFVNRIMVLMMPFMMLIMNGVVLLIVWVGAQQIDIGAMQIGNLFAFMQYSMQIIMSFLMVSFVFILLPRASVSALRIDEVLRVETTINDPSTPISFPADGKGEIEFRNVGFRYPCADENVLCSINFTAKPGETTAFIGSTGSGKSTLINLIPRFYDVTEGEILIDGVDIRKVTQKALREKIGYVPQNGVLFTGDIASNIRYGRPQATDEEIRQAAQTAQAMDFIDASEEGFGKEIAQGGTNVSGGQKQRVSIARALALRPSIFIFDDSFSALDFKTDAKLRKALKADTANATVLIVAQRIGTIMNADRIIVLDEGTIAGIGTHQELMRDCPVYQEIALSQLSKEELAV